MLTRLALVAALALVAPLAWGGQSQGQAGVASDPDAGLRQCVTEGHVRKIVGGVPACAPDSTAGTAGAWPGLTSGDNNTAVMTCSGACSISGNVLAYTLTPGGVVDGVDAGAATTRTGESYIQNATHNTDCTLITDGVARELCIDEDDGALWICGDNAGCNIPSDWKRVIGPVRAPTQWKLVGCQGTTGSLLVDALATGVPAAECTAGSVNSTMLRGIALFDPTADEAVQVDMLLPATWVAALGVSFRATWRANSALAQDAVWGVQTACSADGEADDLAWNTAQTVTDANQTGAANQKNDFAISSLTMTGCAAGETLHMRVYRDADNVLDTLAADAGLGFFEITTYRTP